MFVDSYMSHTEKIKLIREGGTKGDLYLLLRVVMKELVPRFPDIQ